MSSPDIFFGEGDSGPIVDDTILDSNGAPVDLAGATVVFRYRDKLQVGAEIDEPAAITQTSDPLTLGDVEWAPAGPMQPGNFNANWVITFGSGTPITFPNGRYLWMQVWPKP